jgi:Holliday junction resolvase-like predicted endonuclease
MTTTKPFSSSLYEKNDDAKHLIIDWLNNHGYQAKVNPDKYGIDIIANKDKIKYFYEVEVKHNWMGELFPFDEVHIPSRKRKFAKANSYFVIINHERTHAMFINGAVALASRLVVKSTIYTSNESFMEIPVSECKFIQLGDKDE